MDKTQIKKELLEGAMEGIRAYLDTIRGAHLRADVTRPTPNSAQISIRVPEGLFFFELKVKENQS